MAVLAEILLPPVALDSFVITSVLYSSRRNALPGL
jgi:hypothetical protein